MCYYCIDMCLQTCCIPTYILYVYIVMSTSAADIACARGLDNMSGK